MATTHRPSVLLLDVNETLSDLGPLGARFADVGVPASLAPTWFAGVLRDGFALAVGGTSAPFAEIGAALLRTLLPAHGCARPLDEAVPHVLEGFLALDVHEDVRRGLPRLATSGLRVATLSNGATSVAESLLDRAGLREHLETVMSVEDAGIWKPARAAYAHACGRLDVEPAEVMMVAVHPWDLDGASRAGLATCWIDRSGGDTSYPTFFRAPDLTASGFDDLAARLG